MNVGKGGGLDKSRNQDEIEKIQVRGFTAIIEDVEGSPQLHIEGLARNSAFREETAPPEGRDGAGLRRVTCA
jgi:hypothetical protein